MSTSELKQLLRAAVAFITNALLSCVDSNGITERYLHPGISVSSFSGGTVSNVLAYFLAACLCACRASISFFVRGIRHLKIQHRVITERKVGVGGEDRVSLNY